MAINSVGAIAGSSTAALTVSATFTGTAGVDDAVSLAVYGGSSTWHTLSSLTTNTNGTYAYSVKQIEGAYSRAYTLSSIEYINRTGYLADVLGSTSIDINGYWSIVPTGSYLDSTTSVYVVGGATNDTITAPKNANAAIYGNAGDDTINCGGLINYVYPGAGTNTVVGGGGKNYLHVQVSDGGTNTFYNTTSNDVLRCYYPDKKGDNILSGYILRDGNDLVTKSVNSLGDIAFGRVKDAFLTGHMPSAIELYNYGTGLIDTNSLAATNSTGRYIEAGTTSVDSFLSTASYNIASFWGVCGNGGNDRMYVPESSNCKLAAFLGGDGADAFTFSGKRSQYKITASGMTYDDGSVIPTNGLGTYISYVDSAITSKYWTDAERLEFSNISLALDTGVKESGGQAALLMGAVLGKTLMLSKQSLLGTVIGLFDEGYSMQQLAGALLRLPVWDIFTGVSGPTNKDIATYLLTVVNGAAPSTAALGAAVLEMGLESTATQGSFLAGLALSTENQTQIGLVGIQAAGLEYMLTS